MKKFDIGLLAPDLFEVTIPSDGRVIHMRPFVVKEYKSLMIAKEGGDTKLAVNQALNNCIQEDLDIMTLPVQDAEYLFLQLYMSSTGNNSIPVKYRCSNSVEKEGEQVTCNTFIDANVSIEDAWVPKAKDSSKMFTINKNIKLKMRYPTLNDTTSFDLKTTEGMFKAIVACMDEIHTNDAVYSVDDLKEEIADILDMMPGQLFTDLNTFMRGIPRITTTVKLKCPSCGHTEEVTLKGLDDFFV